MCFKLLLSFQHLIGTIITVPSAVIPRIWGRKTKRASEKSRLYSVNFLGNTYVHSNCGTRNQVQGIIWEVLIHISAPLHSQEMLLYKPRVPRVLACNRDIL